MAEDQLTGQEEGCPHLEEVQDEIKDILKRYRTVVSWHYNRTNEALHQVKRRKVSLKIIRLCSAEPGSHVDCISVLRNL